MQLEHGEMKIGFKGQLCDTSINQIDSFYAEENIKFGMPVQVGTKANYVKTLTETGTYIGIALQVRTEPVGAVVPTSSDTFLSKINLIDDKDGYPENSMMEILRLGRVYLTIDTVTDNVPNKTSVWFDTSDNSFIAANVDPNLSDTTHVKIGTLLSSATAGNLAIVQINLI